jgi:hypothetical protein
MPTKAAVPPPEWIADLGGTTVLPARRRPTRRPAKQAAPEPVPEPVPEEHAAVAVDVPVEVVVEPEAEPEPTGRHEAAGQPSRGRRTAGIGKRFGSTWKRARAVSVESTRS